MPDETEDLWIFAYGSLMWRPDFAFEEHHRARVFGLHRALCIFSHHYRGTVEHPGLVLGLDRGGSCLGLCFRIAASVRAATLDAVRRRELITDVYEEIAAPVRLDDGRRFAAITYRARRGHAQYAGDVTTADAARLVARAGGVAGSNIDYVRATLEHLRGLGIAEHRLAAVVRLCDRYASGAGDLPADEPPQGSGVDVAVLGGRQDP